MSEKYIFDSSKPFLGFVTMSDPGDKKAYSTSTYTVSCTLCKDYQNQLKHEKNAHALDSIEATRTQDHLRAQLAQLRKELATVQEMHACQARAIVEKNTVIKNFETKFRDCNGHTLPEYQALVQEQHKTILKLDAEVIAMTKELDAVKSRNLDPEPQKLKAAILVMQKQIDNLVTALGQEQANHNNDNGKWASRYECDISKKNNEIATLKYENNNIKNHYCCECDSKLVPHNKEVERLGKENCIKQQKIEDQNRKIGAKQEEINELKLALNKAKTKQTFEMKPAVEVMREYEDKIRRLIDVANSKDDIIKGLQGALMGKK